MKMMGGIRSLRKAPSIKMASETGAEEFELELMGVINEYNDLKQKGDPAVRDISVDEYINMYLSRKKKSPDRMMASNDMNQRLLEKLYEDFLDQGLSPEKAKQAAEEAFRAKAAYGGRMQYGSGTEEIVKPSKSMMMDTTTYPLGQDPQFDDKLIYKPGPEDSKEFKRLKELMERKKAKVKVKRAMGGIAGVL